MTERIAGFWSALWRHRRAVLLSWDVWAALVLGGLATTMIPEGRLATAAAHVANVGLVVTGAILGVVLAGLAIIVVFLDREYVKVLERAGGVQADFFPFWFTAALAVCTIVLDAALLLFAETLPLGGLRVAVGVVLWFALWTLFATLNLVAFVGAHGENRALQILRGERERSEDIANRNQADTASRHEPAEVKR